MLFFGLALTLLLKRKLMLTYVKAAEEAVVGGIVHTAVGPDDDVVVDAADDAAVEAAIETAVNAGVDIYVLAEVMLM